MWFLPNRAEITQNLKAAFGVLLLNDSAFDHFKNDPTRFWQSFGFALQLLPLTLVYFLLTVSVSEPSFFSYLKLLIFYLSIYTIAWTLWPLMARTLCQALDLDANYIRYICLYNWFGALVSIIAILSDLLWQMNVFSSGAAATALIALIFAPLFIHMVVIHRLLNQPYIIAFVIALGELIMTLALMLIRIQVLAEYA